MENTETKTGQMVRIFPNGECIIKEGTSGTKAYVILKGEVEISKAVNDEKQVLSILKAGEFFGEMSSIRGTERMATASAKGQVECIEVPSNNFVQLLQTKPELGIRLLKLLGKRLDEANKKIEKLTLMNQNERVTIILSDIAIKHQSKPFEPMKMLYDNALNHIASKTRTDRSTVEKAIVTLARYGKVEIIDEGKNKYISFNEKLFD